MMNELYDLCDNLKDEIRELNKKGDISPTELDRAYKAVDIIKDIKTIEAMEQSGGSFNYSNEDGYSRRGSYENYSNNSYNSYEGNSNARRGRDGDGDGRYSEARGRDAMGRYTSRDGNMSRENYSREGYSGHEEKEHMMQQIEQMKRKIEQM